MDCSIREVFIEVLLEEGIEMMSQNDREDYDRLARLCEAKDAEIERLENIEQSQFHLNEQLIQQLSEAQAQIARQAVALKDLIEDVEVTKEDRNNFLNFRRYAKHDSDCPHPRGDQACGCGYSSFKFNMDMLLDACEGYDNRAPIDKARQVISATSETVAAWRAKETEPYKREVAMMRYALMQPVDFNKQRKALSDTQATALAYEQEVESRGAVKAIAAKLKHVQMLIETEQISTFKDKRKWTEGYKQGCLDCAGLIELEAEKCVTTRL